MCPARQVFGIAAAASHAAESTDMTK